MPKSPEQTLQTNVTESSGASYRKKKTVEIQEGEPQEKILLIYRENDIFRAHVPEVVKTLQSIGRKVDVHGFSQAFTEDDIEKWTLENARQLLGVDIVADDTVRRVLDDAEYKSEFDKEFLENDRDKKQYDTLEKQYKVSNSRDKDKKLKLFFDFLKSSGVSEKKKMIEDAAEKRNGERFQGRLPGYLDTLFDDATAEALLHGGALSAKGEQFKLPDLESAGEAKVKEVFQKILKRIIEDPARMPDAVIICPESLGDHRPFSRGEEKNAVDTIKTWLEEAGLRSKDIFPGLSIRKLDNINSGYNARDVLAQNTYSTLKKLARQKNGAVKTWILRDRHTVQHHRREDLLRDFFSELLEIQYREQVEKMSKNELKEKKEWRASMMAGAVDLKFPVSTLLEDAVTQKLITLTPEEERIRNDFITEKLKKDFKQKEEEAKKT